VSSVVLPQPAELSGKDLLLNEQAGIAKLVSAAFLVGNLMEAGTGIGHSARVVVDLHRAMTVSSVSLPSCMIGTLPNTRYKARCSQTPRETARSWMLALSTSDSSIRLKLKKT